MKFTPLSDQEISQGNLIKPGEYDFQVIEAEERISKKGNAYINLKLMIWDEEGKERTFFANLAWIKILKNFCDATELADKYQHGEVLPEDCLNRTGRCYVGIEEGKADDRGGFYPSKNVVEAFHPAKKSFTAFAKRSIPQQQQTNLATDFEEDDLPF